jgi:hypothetical protein
MPVILRTLCFRNIMVLRTDSVHTLTATVNFSRRYPNSFSKQSVTNEFSRLWHLAVEFSCQGQQFDPRPICVGFVVDKVALGQVFLGVYYSFPLSVSFH